MKKFLVVLLLLAAAPALAALRCEEVVAGMGANDVQASREDMGTLLRGAREKSLPVRVHYRGWVRGPWTVEGFVLSEHRGYLAPRVFTLQLDDRQVDVALSAIAVIEVLPHPPEPKLSDEQRKALDHLWEAWERRRPIRLYRSARHRGFFAGLVEDAPDRVIVRAVRRTVAGAYVVDYERVDSEFRRRGTWQFAEIRPHTVRWD